MPSFSTTYTPPGSYVQFLRENLSPSLVSDYRIPVIIGSGSTTKSTSLSLTRGSGPSDTIGVDNIEAISALGSAPNLSDYTLGVDYSLGSGANAGKVIWANPGVAVVGNVVVNALNNSTLPGAVTVTKTGNLVTDSYVVEVVKVGAGSTKAVYRGDNPMATSISVSESIVITIDAVAHTAALFSGMTSAQVLSTIQSAIGSAGTVVQNTNSQLQITSATQGVGSTVGVTIVSSSLKQQLGVNDGVSDDFVYTAGTAGTGTFTITPRSTRITTTFSAGQVPITAIPGVSLILNSTAARTANERLEIVTTADQVVKNPLVGATYYLTVSSDKAVTDYDLAYFTSDEESVFYQIYGDPSPSNTISLGAYIAFRNQVSIIGVVQLQGGNDLPHFQQAIDKLLDRPVYYLVPLSTDPLVHAYLKAHVDGQSSVLNRRERVGLCGGASNYSIFDTTDSASSIDDERVTFVGPSTWQLQYLTSANLAQTVTVDGSFAAVMVAAAAANRDPAEPLTRKQLVGLTPLVTYNPTQQNQLAASGVMVLDTIGGVTRIRHQVTTDYNGPIESKEFSIVQLRDYVSITLRNNLDAEYIGIKILRATPKIIESYVEQILEGLVAQGVLNGFSDVTATQNAVDPTEIDISFSAQPVYPLNFVLVTFKFVQTAQQV